MLCRCALSFVFFLSVLGHADTGSLVDLVKQSALRLNPKLLGPLERLEVKAPSLISAVPQLLTDQTTEAPVGNPSTRNGPTSEQTPLDGTTGSDASIQEAVDLVLQYIQLTSNFTGMHNITSLEENATAWTTSQTPQAMEMTALMKTESKQHVSAPHSLDHTSHIPPQHTSMEQVIERPSLSADGMKNTGIFEAGVSVQEAIKLLMELGPTVIEPQTQDSQTRDTDSTCKGPCPPKWLKILNFFSHLLSPGSEMCHIYQVMGLERCDSPNTSCKPGYTCCSSSCLPEIVVCDPWYPHTIPDHICLPEDVSRWWPEVQDKFHHIIGHGNISREQNTTTETAITPSSSSLH